MALHRFFALLLAVFVLAGFQDDAAIQQLIGDLVHPDPARQLAAQKGLMKLGPKALPQLKAAFESKTPELATRARFVAAEIERVEFEKQHDATQRPRRLEIVTLQLKDGTLGEAIKVLGGQVESTIHTTLDQKMKLTIDVKDLPLRKCLDQIEQLLNVNVVSKYTWHKIEKGPAPKRKRAYTPGVTFDFGFAPFTPGGEVVGWALTTDSSGPAKAFVDSFEVVNSQKAAVEVVRCGRCSPRFALLKTDQRGPFTIRLKGRVVWENPYDFGVVDPAKPQDFRVGSFHVRYEWPKIAWSASDPVPKHLVGRAEFSAKLKKQVQTPGGAMGVGVPSTVEQRAQNSWCSCPAGSPQPISTMPPVLLAGGSYFEGAFRTRKPDEFESLKVRFFKAIEEPFTAEATVQVD